MTEDQLIAQGQTIDRFLADEVVVAAFQRLEEAYLKEFIDATRTETMQHAHAKLRVLKDLSKEFTITSDRGKRAAAEKKRREPR